MKKYLLLLAVTFALISATSYEAEAQTSVEIVSVQAAVPVAGSPYYQDIVTVQTCATNSDVYGSGVKGKIVQEPQIGLAANINDPAQNGTCGKTYQLVIWLTKKQTKETRVYTGYIWTDDGYVESSPFTVN